MKKFLWAMIGLILLVGGIGLREWLVREEIDATQDQLRTQLNEMVKSASTRERMNELSGSSFVFEKFVAPVFEATNRLLWPSSRVQALFDWTRSVHQEISKTSETKQEAMKTQYNTEVKNLREAATPSVDRMIQIMKKAEALDPTQSASEIAITEMKALKEFGQKKDDTVLSSVKEEGLKRLMQLRKMLKKADHKRMGEFLSSGKFVQEIQQPAIELILQIRQEDIRKQAWKEFRLKLSEILSKRSIQLTNSERMKKSKEIEKLFEEPMAKLFEQEDRPLAPVQNLPTPPSAVIPRDEDLYNESELGSPSDANSPHE
jgi:hypothetical protein